MYTSHNNYFHTIYINALDISVLTKYPETSYRFLLSEVIF